MNVWLSNYIHVYNGGLNALASNCTHSFYGCVYFAMHIHGISILQRNSNANQAYNTIVIDWCIGPFLRDDDINPLNHGVHKQTAWRHLKSISILAPRANPGPHVNLSTAVASPVQTFLSETWDINDVQLKPTLKPKYFGIPRVCPLPFFRLKRFGCVTGKYCFLRMTRKKTMAKGLCTHFSRWVGWVPSSIIPRIYDRCSTDFFLRNREK